MALLVHVRPSRLCCPKWQEIFVNDRPDSDDRTTRHPGYGMSQSRRAMVECIFGWGKQHGTMRKTKHRGIAGVATDFLLNLIAYNLIRIPKLLAA